MSKINKQFAGSAARHGYAYAQFRARLGRACVIGATTVAILGAADVSNGQGGPDEQRGLDQRILDALNANHRLGCHPPQVIDMRDDDCSQGIGIPRIADRIVNLNTEVVSVDNVQIKQEINLGPLASASISFEFLNCGSLTETRTRTEKLVQVLTSEIETTNSIKTTEQFKGTLKSEAGQLFAKVGVSAEYSTTKELSLVDRNKHSNTKTEETTETFNLVAPPMTKIVYEVATTGGKNEVEFEGTLLVGGTFHYVVGDIWDQDASIDDTLTYQERLMPFTGTLTTYHYDKVTISKTETPVTTEFCAGRATGNDSVTVGPVEVLNNVN